MNINYAENSKYCPYAKFAYDVPICRLEEKPCEFVDEEFCISIVNAYKVNERETA